MKKISNSFIAYTNVKLNEVEHDLKNDIVEKEKNNYKRKDKYRATGYERDGIKF
mgnify:CR=1 FL=1